MREISHRIGNCGEEKAVFALKHDQEVIQGDDRGSLLPFTVLFFAALIVGVAAAVVVSPLAAWGVAAAGFRFPFPRIFDRTVMVTLGLVLVLMARPLRLLPLLKHGFVLNQTEPPAAGQRPGVKRAIGLSIGGLIVALTAIAVLFAIAAAMGAGGPHRDSALLFRAGKYIGAAIAIAIIEEGFFRAFLLGGMRHDFGRAGALIGSAVIYSLAHLVRAPKHYYISGFHGGAGLHDFILSVTRLIHPGNALGTILGLFLLGLVLGEAFLLTGSVYFSIGMHAGFVIGAKSWPVLGDHGARMPQWLAGTGPVPLIGGAGAWFVALILMALLPVLLSRARLTTAYSPQRQMEPGLK
ncbi:MAG: CPBP family glutamic-type intramembrane protease [Candidatus Binataceae bacterium]